MTFRAHFITGLLCVSLSGCNPSRNTHLTAKDVAEVQLKSLSRNSQWKMLGLSSADEASHAILGSPIPVFIGRADEMAKYNSGDLNEIIHPTDNVVFPVLVNGQGKMLIEVGREHDDWVPVRDGYQDSARLLVESQLNNPGKKADFVKVGSMNESSYLIQSDYATNTGSPGGEVASSNTEGLNLGSNSVVLPLNNAAQAIAETAYESPVLSKHQNVKSTSNAFGIVVPNVLAPNAPGAAAPPTQPSAQDFFRKVAPIAQQSASHVSNGPGS
jgi:hypothetical protein